MSSYKNKHSVKTVILFLVPSTFSFVASCKKCIKWMIVEHD